MSLTIVTQIVPLVLVTAGIGACAAVFMTLKREIFGVAKQLKLRDAEIEELKNRSQKMAEDLEALRGRVHESEERTGVLVAPIPPKSGLNLNKRSQVLRMSRIGEKPSNIATALNLPRREVELLLKVQQIVLSSAIQT